MGFSNIYLFIFEGVAVYNQLCLPLSEPITNTSLWTFTINVVNTTTVITTTVATATTLNSSLQASISPGFCQPGLGWCIATIILSAILFFSLLGSAFYLCFRCVILKIKIIIVLFKIMF